MTTERSRSKTPRQLGTVVHAIPEGCHLGGQRLAFAMLMCFGERFRDELEARALAAETAEPAGAAQQQQALAAAPVTRLPRKPRRRAPRRLDDVMSAWCDAPVAPTPTQRPRR